MIEALQQMLLLHRRAQAIVEIVLWLMLHHPVGAGDQYLGRHGNGSRIGHHPFGRLVEAQQNVHRDGPGDQWVVVETGLPFRIVGEELRLHIAVDEKVASQLVQQLEARSGKGHIEFHLEGRRGQHQGPDLRRVVMHPGRGDHRTHALSQHGDLLLRDGVGLLDMIDETLHIPHRGAEAGRVAPLARRATVAAGIPGKDVEVRQAELVRQMRHAPGVLVTPMEHHHRTTPLTRGGPMTVEEFHAIMGGEAVFSNGALG